MESHFFLFGNSVTVGARKVHGLHKTYHRHIKSFWTHSMVLLRDVAQVEAHSGPFEDSANFEAR
jgi:hypothetical protein